MLEEVAGELLPDTVVLMLEFESTEAARALWPKIENTVNPLYPDDKSDKTPDQGTRLLRRHQGGSRRLAANSPLRFTRGDGLLARMLHIHAGVVEEVSAAS